MTPVLLATHSEGQLRMFTRNGSGLTPRGVLDVETASPELLATLTADLADALGWVELELPARPQRTQVEAPAPTPLPAAQPPRRKHAGRKMRPTAEVEAHRQQLLALIAAQPGITTRSLGVAADCSGQQVANMLGRPRADGLVRCVTQGPGDPARWYPT